MNSSLSSRAGLLGLLLAAGSVALTLDWLHAQQGFDFQPIPEEIALQPHRVEGSRLRVLS